MLDQKWDSKISLVFTNVVLTKTLGQRNAREIRARIDRRLDLWERIIHAGLVGDALAEGRDQDSRVEKCIEDEEDRLVCSFYSTWLSGNLWQVLSVVLGNWLRISSGRNNLTCVYLRGNLHMSGLCGVRRGAGDSAT